MEQLKLFGWLVGEDSLKSAEDCRLTFGDTARIPGLSREWGIYHKQLYQPGRHLCGLN